ncbi:hypothetical protein EVAR_103643_1 [Eumeta japonica]|uniref:Uncharacterized protein n=1 Tax=Eumeta variegata TaxID=151549 RepID=A0A4C2A0S8_EUMVA|nr:hypothetical protein EVAR_103643_1 [Eumeta japonica]
MDRSLASSFPRHAAPGHQWNQRRRATLTRPSVSGRSFHEFSESDVAYSLPLHLTNSVSYVVYTVSSEEYLKMYGTRCRIRYYYVYHSAARNNTSPPFTANSMLALLQEAINNVQPEDLSKVVNKTERDIMSDWDRDIDIDNIMESSLIIFVTDSDDEFSDNSDVSDSAMSLDE